MGPWISRLATEVASALAEPGHVAIVEGYVCKRCLISDDLREAQELGTDPDLLLIGRVDIDFES